MIWRRNTGTAAKTIKENYNDWHRFLESNVIAQKKVAKIDMFNLENIRQQSVDPKSSTIMINTLDTDLSDSNPANP